MTRLAVVEDDVNTRAEARRALLRSAIRSGDVRTAARAASRSRLVVMRLEPDEAKRGRDARQRVGRALRTARARQAVTVSPAPTILVARVPSTVARRRPIVIAALTAAMLLILPAHDTIISAADVREAALTEFVCSAVMKAPAAGVALDPTTLPAPQYFGAEPPDVGGGMLAVNRSRAAPIRHGFARLVGRVVDDATGQPLDDACLQYARGSALIRARTDNAGIFAVDLPITARSVDLAFGRAGYRPAHVTLDSWGAKSVSFFFDVRLTAR